MSVLPNNVFSINTYPGVLYVAVSPSKFSTRMSRTAITVQDRSRIEYNVRAWLDLTRVSSDLWHWWPISSLGWPSADSVKLVDELLTKWKSGGIYVADSIIVERATREMRGRIVKAAQDKVGSVAWSFDATNGVFGPGTNKCMLFVHDVLLGAGADVGLPHGMRHKSPPTAGDWGTAGTSIDAWRPIRDPEKPMPGDVVGQAGNYSDATGHVMTVGPIGPDNNVTFIGTSDATGVDPPGKVVQIPFKANIVDAKAVAGPEVFRHWDPLV